LVLSEKDVEFYNENGYLVVPDVLSEVEIARVRAAVDEVVEASRKVTEHTDVYDLEDDHSAAKPRVRRIKTPHKWHPAFGDLVAHEKILDVLDPLIGPELRFDTSKLNIKDASGGSAVEWHQDWAFYPHTNDDLCAVGIMIDDVDLDVGPLMVVPGSHRGPVYDHHVNGVFCGAINDPSCDGEYEKAVPVTGGAGSISIHHVRILHGSAQNMSLRPRRLLLHQYRAADAWPMALMPKDWESYEGQLLRGESSVVPRLEPVPVRLPFPAALNQGSIYENQRATKTVTMLEPQLRQAT
jgi:ectoine hydroxylase-related dioxygenase (phytanoyl-CoA dioxygenase family)